MADREVVRIVWGETSPLSAKVPAESERLMWRLRAVVAKLAAAAIRGGLDDKLNGQNAPSGEDEAALAAWQQAKQVVEDVEAGTLRSDTPLPARAVLWEVAESGKPREAGLPPAATWILEPGAVSVGDFMAGKGGEQRTYRLFESTKVPADGELPYVSGVTGAGVPPTVLARPWYKSVNWGIGLAGGALFFLAAFSILWTSTTFGLAYDILTSRLIVEPKELAKAIPLPACKIDWDVRLCATEEDRQSKAPAADKKAAEEKAAELLQAKRVRLISDFGPVCIAHLAKWTEDERLSRQPQATPRKPHKNDLFCLTVWGYAVTYAAQRSPFNVLLGWHIPTAGIQTVSLGTPTALMMLGVVLVLVGLGRGYTGKALGALIAPNGRASLALAQVTAWTVLILTSVAAIAIFNGGLVSEFLRYFSNLPEGATGPTAYAKGFFPTIPEGIWAVLGISFGSTMISTLLKTLRGYGTAANEVASGTTRQIGGVGFFKAPVTGSDPSHRASIADWFVGEEEDTKNKIDISRVQMVLITAGLLVTYANAIFAAIRNLPQYEIVAAIQSVDVLIGTMPPVGTAMAVMLTVSHATYLVAKAAEVPGTAPGKPEAPKPGQ